MPLPKSATVAARATEVYSEVCPLVLQEACPRPGDDESATRELPQLLPFLRQLLTCCACAGLLEEAMISLACGHCYCYQCQFKEPVLKILCRQCKERKALVVENQLRLVVGCYRKLMKTLSLSAKWSNRDCVADPKDPDFSPIPEIIREVTQGVKVSRAVLVVRPPERFLNVRQVPTPKKEMAVVGRSPRGGRERRKTSPKGSLKEQQTNTQKKMKLASQIVKRRLQYTSTVIPSTAAIKKAASIAKRKKSETQKLIKLLGEESMTEEETGWTSTTESQGTLSDDDFTAKLGTIQSLENCASDIPVLEVVSECLSDPPTRWCAQFEVLATQLMQKPTKKECAKSPSLRASGRMKRAKRSRTPFAPRSRWMGVRLGSHRRSRKKHSPSGPLALLQLTAVSSPTGEKSGCEAVVISTTPTGKTGKTKSEASQRSHKKVLIGTSAIIPKKLIAEEETHEVPVFQLPMPNLSFSVPTHLSSPSGLIADSLVGSEDQSLLPLVTSYTPPGFGATSSSAMLSFDLNEILAQAAATPPPKKKKKKKQKKLPTSFDCKLTLEEIEELRRKPRFRCRCGTNPGVMFLDMICCKHKCPCFLHEIPCLRCKCRGCNNPFNKTMVTKETVASSSSTS